MSVKYAPAASFAHTKNRKMKRTLLLVTAVAASFIIGYAMGNSKKPEHTSTNGVTGIGGVFFKCKDPKKLKEWYDSNLGFRNGPYGTNFEWRQAGDSMKKGFTLWAPFKETTRYFEKEFMINYRVSNMDALLASLKTRNILPIDSVQRDATGAFVHIMDPEGNRIQLWEPNDVEYYNLGPETTVY